MTKKFANLRAQMSPASQARAEAKVQAMLTEMPLNNDVFQGGSPAINRAKYGCKCIF